MAEPAVQTPAPAAPHSFVVRVYWEDTDAGGIVYYANYLKFMERARSDLVRRAGIDQAALLARDGVMFPVRRCAVDYHRPARLEDELTVSTSVSRVGGASVDLAQDIERHGERLVSGRVQLACINRAGRPQRLPAEVRRAFAGALAAGQGAG